MTEQALEPDENRRGFINWFLGTECDGVRPLRPLPGEPLSVPPTVGESTAGTVTLPIKPDEVKPNTGQIFKFGSRPGILIRTSAGDLRAFSAVCTHLDCTVQYRPDLSEIWCACHNGHYDLNGKNVAGPPPRPLERSWSTSGGARSWSARAPDDGGRRAATGRLWQWLDAAGRAQATWSSSPGRSRFPSTATRSATTSAA